MQFPLDPNMAEWVRPRLNRRNPHELHWRRQPPESQGSIDKSHGHLYSHLADHACCMQCGAIPCPFDHDEHKRLKLADLEFVKDLAKERRELKDKVNQMTDQLRQYERMEQEWERQRSMMENEIDRLKMLNTENLKRIQAFKKDQDKLKMLTQKVRDLEKENTALKEENQGYKLLISNQSNTIESLETTNVELTKENEEGKCHIRKLQVQLDDAQEELVTTRVALTSKNEQIAELESALSALTRELANRVQEFTERNEANEKLIEELQSEVDCLLAKIRSLEQENGGLKTQIVEYLKEIEYLKSRIASDKRFKQFVTIKRECNDLKEKNDTLMFKVYEHEKVCPPMPFMNARGRIKSANRMRSVSPPTKRPVSASGDKSLLNRPKSAARTLVGADGRADYHE